MSSNRRNNASRQRRREQRAHRLAARRAQPNPRLSVRTSADSRLTVASDSIPHDLMVGVLEMVSAPDTLTVIVTVDVLADVMHSLEMAHYAPVENTVNAFIAAGFPYPKTALIFENGIDRVGGGMYACGVSIKRDEQKVYMPAVVRLNRRTARIATQQQNAFLDALLTHLSEKWLSTLPEPPIGGDNSLVLTTENFDLSKFSAGEGRDDFHFLTMGGVRRAVRQGRPAFTITGRRRPCRHWVRPFRRWVKSRQAYTCVEGHWRGGQHTNARAVYVA